MSFILQNFSRSSVSYNKDSFVGYHFKHPTDTIVQINADDYFITQQRSLEIDDLIQVKAVDGLVTLQITALTPAVTTDIVIQSLDENGNVVFNTLQLKNLNGGGHIVSSITPLGGEPQLIDDPNFVTFIDTVTRVGIGTAGPDASASLDVVSTISGILFPRMTTVQRDAIASPADGLVIFDITTVTLNVRAGGVWKVVATV